MPILTLAALVVIALASIVTLAYGVLGIWYARALGRATTAAMHARHAEERRQLAEGSAAFEALKRQAAEEWAAYQREQEAKETDR